MAQRNHLPLLTPPSDAFFVHPHQQQLVEHTFLHDLDPNCTQYSYSYSLSEPASFAIPSTSSHKPAQAPITVYELQNYFNTSAMPSSLEHHPSQSFIPPMSPSAFVYSSHIPQHQEQQRRTQSYSSAFIVPPQGYPPNLILNPYVLSSYMNGYYPVQSELQTYNPPYVPSPHPTPSSTPRSPPVHITAPLWEPARGIPVRVRKADESQVSRPTMEDAVRVTSFIQDHCRAKDMQQGRSYKNTDDSPTWNQFVHLLQETSTSRMTVDQFFERADKLFAGEHQITNSIRRFMPLRMLSGHSGTQSPAGVA